MSNDNIEQIVEAARDNAEAFQFSEQQAFTISETGQINDLSQTFIRTDRITQQAFVGDDFVEDDSVSLLLVIGDAWIDAEIVNRGIARDAIDPSQIVDEFEFLIGVGENVGLVVEDGELSGGGRNLIVNGAAALLGGIGLYKIANFIYKQHTEDDSETLWDAINPFNEIGQIDPVTGEEIELETVTPNPRLDDLSNVITGPVLPGNILARDNSCNWVEQQLEGTEIQENDITAATNICIINFGDNLNVTDDADGKVTIDAVTGVGDTQNLFETMTADTGSTTADSPSDTFNIIGGANITTSISGDTITIIGVDPGSGEVNTGSNVGGGAEVFKTKELADLIHRTLIAGTGINVIQNPDTIVISTGDGSTTAPEDNPCDEDAGSTCGVPLTAPPDIAGGLVLLTQGTPITEPIEAVGTSKVTLHFYFPKGLFLQKTFSLPSQAISQTFACDDLFPLEAEEAGLTIPCFEAGTINILVEVLSDPCSIDETIMSTTLTFVGYNDKTFSQCADVEWNAIDNTGCLNKFPGTVISPTTNVRIRMTRVDELSSTDIFYEGMTPTVGTDWFDGGNNKSRDADKIPTDLTPPAVPTINIFDDEKQPAFAPA